MIRANKAFFPVLAAVAAAGGAEVVGAGEAATDKFEVVSVGGFVVSNIWSLRSKSFTASAGDDLGLIEFVSVAVVSATGAGFVIIIFEN